MVVDAATPMRISSMYASPNAFDDCPKKAPLSALGTKPF
jgi:hypothetical protein